MAETEQNGSDEQQEYDAILAAVMETPRGRWFIEEFTRRNRTADTQTLLSAIESIGNVAQTATAPTQTVDVLRLELQEMSASIQQTRSEIAAIKPTDGGNNRIMSATGELDAIVTATERATSEILAAAERTQEIAEKLKEQGADEDLCDELEAHATAIFMACSFQDITGQRTTKVVQVLHYLEHRVNSMISIWGVEPGDEDRAMSTALLDPQDKRPDAHLLNGPQSEENATSQDDIDAMMNDLDSVDDIDDIDMVAGEPATTAAANGHSELVIADDLEFAEPAAPAPVAAPTTDIAADETGEEIAQDDIDALFN
ncbi:protein phosphatase CheZ [Parvibaculaceae bacterium PLY_AMNH_Bact1]|nr:protein phosphatase CheZ [Parvibaculaceae bacterium PLY_AMNH_Bact1]